jgi:hypothetical protein
MASGTGTWTTSSSALHALGRYTVKLDIDLKNKDTANLLLPSCDEVRGEMAEMARDHGSPVIYWIVGDPDSGTFLKFERAH